MRWTRAARETNAVCLRTVKSCGSDAPILGVKPVRRSAGDGVKKRGHRGEREVSRKTIARGMPGRSGVTVVTMLVCLFYFAREAAGALRARHSLRPLIFSGQEFKANLGRIAPRERGVLFWKLGQRHCEERKRRSNPFFVCAALWIASRSLSSGAHSRDPLARNDG